MKNDRDHDPHHGHSHHLDFDKQRSVSQAGLLEKDIDDSFKNTARIDDLITKTSELDRLTTHRISQDFNHIAIWIGLVMVVGIALLYFLF